MLCNNFQDVNDFYNKLRNLISSLMKTGCSIHLELHLYRLEISYTLESVNVNIFKWDEQTKTFSQVNTQFSHLQGKAGIYILFASNFSPNHCGKFIYIGESGRGNQFLDGRLQKLVEETIGINAGHSAGKRIHKCIKNKKIENLELCLVVIAFNPINSLHKKLEQTFLAVYEDLYCVIPCLNRYQNYRKHCEFNENKIKEIIQLIEG